LEVGGGVAPAWVLYCTVKLIPPVWKRKSEAGVEGILTPTHASRSDAYLLHPFFFIKPRVRWAFRNDQNSHFSESGIDDS